MEYYTVWSYLLTIPSGMSLGVHYIAFSHTDTTSMTAHGTTYKQSEEYSTEYEQYLMCNHSIFNILCNQGIFDNILAVGML
jgi:hypothetical protein